MPLNNLLSEVMKGKINGEGVKLLSNKEPVVNYKDRKRKKKVIDIASLAIYGLGGKYKGVYFTRREAECMVWLLKGKTIGSVADKLRLSSRTIEYYIKNMKSKLGCRTKFELVELVYLSDFMQHVDF